MNLHEYQGKELLKSYGIEIQEGIVAESVEAAVEAYNKIAEETGTKFAVVKAQIHAGGRGKGGGVKVVKSTEDAEETAASILGMMLKTPQTPGGLEGEGKLVRKVLIAEDAYRPNFDECKEFYISILFDRGSRKNVIIYSTE
jgi:succinyl-CoA synthetase beta subunit